ncbi:MAG: septal ring lytic transglycosylase RlpA family protein [Rhodospirillales bacterium]|nr:septal ring lytic transglycosylase RlpA family protein [Rhodospirillales bacterium]
MTRRPLLLASLALCLLAIAGCSEVELALHVVKKFNLETQEEKPPPRVAKPHYKLGSPYQINHVWYYPSYDPNYDRTGVASWYGPAFHGRPTANGERFDMNGVTAAHPTLPLPSRVRVTNLENGRQLELRVNDRGPFVDNRIIDLSRRAAQLLGFKRKGLAKVRVQYLGLDRLEPPVAPQPADQPVLVAAAEPDVALKPRWTKPLNGTVVLPPDKPVRATASASPPRTPKRETASVTSRRLLVEAAVLNGRDEADLLGEQVRTLGTVAVKPERRNGRVVYAVRIGPVDTDDEAAFILAELNRAGFTGSHIVAAGYR